MSRIEVHATLDERLLHDVCSLLDDATALAGHPPVGEHKYAHLTSGARDWTGVVAYDGDELAGYAHVRWNAAGTRPRAATEVVVRPDRPDPESLAVELLDETRALLARTGGGLLYLWVHRVVDPADTLAARTGFRVQRELLFMSRPLREPPAPLAAPEGVTVRTYRPGKDEAALLAVNNAAFEGHPEQGDWDEATLRARQELSWFDPEGLLCAWQDGRMLGFHWTKWHGHEPTEAAHEPVGEVYVLAVAPEAQGLGLGRMLLREGLQHLHERGCRTAILYVDASSAGPVALYESEGFAAAYKEVCYEQFVPAAAAAGDDLLRPA